MKLVLGKEFPSAPPKGFFLTKIFHPNVGPSGEICVNVLKRDWSAELGLRHVLLVRGGCGGGAPYGRGMGGDRGGLGGIEGVWGGSMGLGGALGWDPPSERGLGVRGGRFGGA